MEQDPKKTPTMHFGEAALGPKLRPMIFEEKKNFIFFMKILSG
jgi:hypothetical protein